MKKAVRIIISGLALCSSIALASEQLAAKKPDYVFVKEKTFGFPVKMPINDSMKFGKINGHVVSSRTNSNGQLEFLLKVNDGKQDVVLPFVPGCTNDNYGIQSAFKPTIEGPMENQGILTPASFSKLQIATAPVLLVFAIYGAYNGARQLKQLYTTRKKISQENKPAVVIIQ